MIKFCLLIIISSTIALADDIKVMVIDTGITASNLNLDPYVDKDDMLKHPNSYTDFYYNNHGTFIAGLVVKDVCKQVKLYSCNYKAEYEYIGYNPNLLACFQRAVDEHMNIVNYSGGGPKPNDEEKEVLTTMLKDGKTFFITAAGNEGTNLGKKCEGYYPACYHLKNMVIVGNIDETSTQRPYNRAEHSNYGYPGMVWRGGMEIKGIVAGNKNRTMNGTSASAAIYTNSLLKYLCEEIRNGHK